jgi:hypothetical protein
MPCYRRHDRDDLERRVGKPAPACHCRQMFIGCHHRREPFAKPSIISGVPQRRHRDTDKDATACNNAGRLAHVCNVHACPKRQCPAKSGREQQQQLQPTCYTIIALSFRVFNDFPVVILPGPI